MSQLHLALTKKCISYNKLKTKFKSLDIIGTGGGSSLFSKSIEEIEKFVARNGEAGKVTHMNRVRNMAKNEVNFI